MSRSTAFSPTQVLPASLYGPARRRLTPAAAGRSDLPHVALTFDDGPDPRSTPLFVEALARHGCRATFFLIGERATAHPDVVRLLHEAGHELAVHGWTHRCAARLSPSVLAADVQRTRDLVEDLTGQAVRWYRPPYGIATVSSTRAARRSGLEPVLWSAWGRDWTRRASAERVTRTVSRTLRSGGTVLLHDTDAYSAPGSWRATLSAVDLLLARWAEAGLPAGPLSEHGLQPAPQPAPHPAPESATARPGTLR